MLLPWYSLPLAGGLLLHISTSSFLSLTGRILGVSGIIDGAAFDRTGWKVASAAGLLIAPTVNRLLGLYDVAPPSLPMATPLATVIAAGFLVGLGSRLGSGCTSGHFLCGFSRFSPRSIVATGIFFPTAMVVANYVSPIAPSSRLYSDVPATPLVIVTLAALSLRYILPRVTSTSDSLLAAFSTSLTFATGLTLSGMVNASTVLDFMRVPPLTSDWSQWDPSLAFLAVTGLGGNAVHWAVSGSKRSKGKLDGAGWHVPTRRDIDARLVTGALAFGVGWGLLGVCPGPFVVNLGESLAGLRSLAGLPAFGLSLVAGMAVARSL